MVGEPRAVLHDDVHGHEIVEVTLGRGSLELAERAEGIDGHDGHDVLQHLLEAEGCKGVAVDDGDAGATFAHGVTSS